MYTVKPFQTSLFGINCNYLSTGCPVLVSFANKQSYVPETVWHHGSHVGFEYNAMSVYDFDDDVLHSNCRPNRTSHGDRNSILVLEW